MFQKKNTIISPQAFAMERCKIFHRWFLKYGIVGIIICFSMYYIIIPACFNYFGRCAMTGEWYTSSQKIDLVLQDLLKKGSHEVIYGSPSRENIFIPTIETVDTFKKIYPTCCRSMTEQELVSYIGKSNADFLERGVLERCLGGSSEVLEFSFKERVKKSSGLQEDQYIQFISIPNNCGNLSRGKTIFTEDSFQK